MVVQHEMNIHFTSGDVECMQIFAKRLCNLLVTFRRGDTITSDMISDIMYSLTVILSMTLTI